MVDRIQLLGRVTSANVQKPMWALEEAGVAYEQTEMGGKFGGLDTPDYVALNPNSLVPTLRDGDLVVWESHAIIRYIAAKYASGVLWPEAPERRALVDQWTDWTAMRFQPAWIGVFMAVVRTPADKRDAGKVGAAVSAAEACFAIIDAQLEKTPFLAGDGLTYADIAAGVSLYRWKTMEIERTAFPAVDAWHDRLLARPAFVKCVNISYDDLRA